MTSTLRDAWPGFGHLDVLISASGSGGEASGRPGAACMLGTEMQAAGRTLESSWYKFGQTELTGRKQLEWKAALSSEAKLQSSKGGMSEPSKAATVGRC